MMTRNQTNERNHLEMLSIEHILPYTRLKTKDGFFRKHEYVYDEYYDSYICPNNQTLPYVTTTKKDYRQFISNPTIYSTVHS